MITGAEAVRIQRTLESVAGWAGEIIVVLNEDVSDGTDRIAESYGAKVFREPWKGFVGQKNSAADKCSQPWLLNLDADEIVPPELQNEIATVVTLAQTPYAAYEFPRCTFYCGRWIRHGDWYPDRVLRLWRRTAARWVGQEPHAHLEVIGQIGRLRSDLSHFSMENMSHHVRKTNSYSDIFASQHAGLKVGVLELWFRPWWRFARGYFLRLGFLDGWQGYAIARMVAFETFLRYAKVPEAQTSKAEPLPKS